MGNGNGSGGQDENQCWVCVGKAETKSWLTGFEVIKREQEKERANVEEEEYPPCLVCYDDGKYGVSTECMHFYCEECIKFSLEAMLDLETKSGEIPHRKGAPNFPPESRHFSCGK